MSTSEERRALEGMYCLTFENGKMIQQGRIKHPVAGDGCYLIQWFSWITGDPTSMSVLHVSDMADWRLYDDEDYWRHEGLTLSRNQAAAARARSEDRPRKLDLEAIKALAP